MYITTYAGTLCRLLYWPVATSISGGAAAEGRCCIVQGRWADCLRSWCCTAQGLLHGMAAEGFTPHASAAASDMCGVVRRVPTERWRS
jgi:hypothetical protein